MAAINWLGLAAGAALGFSAVTQSALAERLERVQERGVLTIAVYNDFAPYSCNARAGGLTGVDVELARALAERMNLRAELVGFGSDDSMDSDIQILKQAEEYDEWRGQNPDKEAPDLMMHVPLDPVFADRNPEFSFFGGYYHELMAVLYDRDRLGDIPAVVSSPDPFTGMPIGVEMYTLSYIFLTNGFDGRLRDSTVNHKSVALAVESLLNGDVAAVMAPRGELQAALAGFNEVEGNFGISALTDLFRTDRVRSAWDVGLATAKGSPALDSAVEAALEGMRSDGTLAEIFSRYGIAWMPAGANGLDSMADAGGPAGIARQGLDSGRICAKHVPAGLL
ncbi:MAG: transporter substrate-binding domain-containing protein [Rhodobacteraceae bacterium]|nr:transporter substrate-binding domain-containing protein [Paracoccaceae bacterium]